MILTVIFAIIMFEWSRIHIMIYGLISRTIFKGSRKQFWITFFLSDLVSYICTFLALFLNEKKILIFTLANVFLLITILFILEQINKKKLYKVLINRIKGLDYMHLNDDQLTDIINYKYTKYFSRYRKKDEYYLNNNSYKCDDVIGELILKYGKSNSNERIIKTRQIYSVKSVRIALKKIIKKKKDRLKRDKYNLEYNDDYVYDWHIDAIENYKNERY